MLFGLVLASLALPLALAHPHPAAATGSDGALVGLWPDQNISLNPADAFTPGQYLQPAQLSDLPAMNAWMGKPNSVINQYGSPDSNTIKLLTTNIWDTYHAVPMFSFTSTGSSDNTVPGLASSLHDWITGTDNNGIPAPPGGRRAYLRLNWEGNGNWYSYAPAAIAASGTCDDLLRAEQGFVSSWRYVHDAFMNTGLTSSQVQWVFSIDQVSVMAAQLQNCANGASDIVRNIYPGDAYVDWTGIDGYSFCAGQAPDTGGQPAETAAPNDPSLPPDQIFGPMVAELRSITSRPVSVDEVGTDTEEMGGTAVPMVACATPAEKGQWVAAYLNYLQTANIKLSMWFNNNLNLDAEPSDFAVFSKAADPMSQGDCTLMATPGVLYNTYCEYPQGLTSPYYATLDPANSRVIDDAEFQGTWTYTPGGTVPAAPAVTATSGQDQVSLSWQVSNDGGSAITGYEILRSTTSGMETAYQALGPQPTWFTDTAVTPGTTYFYEVEAKNAIGTGPASGQVSAAPAHGGALIGIWPGQNISTANVSSPGQNGQYDNPSQASYLPAMNAWQGKPNAVMAFDRTLDPNAFTSLVPLIWDNYHSIPMWSLDLGSTNAQVAAGTQDGSLTSFGQALTNWVHGTDALGQAAPAGGRRIFLRLNYEGNGSSNASQGSTATWAATNPANLPTSDCQGLLSSEQTYVAAWRRAHDIIMSTGLNPTEVQWVFSVNSVDLPPAGLSACANGASDVTRGIYPGDAYVDWTGIDGSTNCSRQSPSALFGTMAVELKSISTRPLSIDSVGDTTYQCMGTGSVAAKGSWVSGYMTWAQSASVKMSVWFNDDNWEVSNSTDWALFGLASNPADIASSGDCTATSGGLTYNAYCEYAQALAGAYFAGGDPSNGQVVTDAVFEGSGS